MFVWPLRIYSTFSRIIPHRNGVSGGESWVKYKDKVGTLVEVAAAAIKFLLDVPPDREMTSCFNISCPVTSDIYEITAPEDPHHDERLLSPLPIRKFVAIRKTVGRVQGFYRRCRREGEKTRGDDIFLNK